jgi:hypothetical protein
MMRRRRLLRSLVFVLAGSLTAVAAPPARRAQESFRKAIEEPIVFRADDRDLRSTLQELDSQRQFAFLVDRRIDTSRVVSWEIKGESLAEAMNRQLPELSAALSIVGTTCYIGPEEAASRLRTLAALRDADIKAAAKTSGGRRLALLSPRTLEWQEATEPREILKQIGDQWRLKITGGDELPYDLWPEGELRNVTAGEALSLILNQFDRTFEWAADGSAVRLVPAPGSPTIERRFKLAAGAADRAMKQIQDWAPAPEVSVRQNDLVVVGTVEQLESVENLLHPPKRTTKPEEFNAKTTRFTLSATQVPFSEAIDALESQGLKVAYDAETLKNAGIDLSHRIDVEVEGVDVDQLLKILCQPVGVRFERDGANVKLSPGPGK